jgi:hypothetical protein
MIHVWYCVHQDHSIFTLQQACSVVTSGQCLCVKPPVWGEGSTWFRLANSVLAVDQGWCFLLNFLKDNKTSDNIHHWLHSQLNVSRLLNILWQTCESKVLQQLQEEKRPRNATPNGHIRDALPLWRQNVCSTRWCSHVCSSCSGIDWYLHGPYVNNMNGYIDGQWCMWMAQICRWYIRSNCIHNQRIRCSSHLQQLSSIHQTNIWDRKRSVTRPSERQTFETSI